MKQNDIFNLAVVFLFTVFTVSCESPTGPPEIRESYVHYRAAWSPDGSTIVFIARINNVQGIYAVDTSGSNFRPIYSGDTGGPTWSPDSKWLAFSQGLSIWKVKTTGDSLKQLTNGGNDVRPSWSRDGKTIAYARTSIWLVDVNGDTTRQLINVGDFPTWHPNGTEVVMMVQSPPVYYFYAVRTDTSSFRSMFTLTSSDYCSFSSISPNGNELIFSLTPSNDYTQIWRADMTSRQLSKLTDDGGDFAAWSPDGSKIVYTRTQYGDGGLWIMNADGSGKRRLTSP